MAMIICTCGAVYDGDTVKAAAGNATADKHADGHGRRKVDAPEQKSVSCRMCGAVVYRTIDGKRVKCLPDDGIKDGAAE
jgi:hypothetical protein